MAEAKSAQVVREVWSICLRGEAMVWHSIQQSEINKTDDVRMLVSFVSHKLIDRFKEATGDSIQRIKHFNFTFLDIYKKKGNHTFIKDAKECDLAICFQLVMLPKSFDRALQIIITPPTETKSIIYMLKHGKEWESCYAADMLESQQPQQPLGWRLGHISLFKLVLHTILDSKDCVSITASSSPFSVGAAYTLLPLIFLFNLAITNNL